MPQFDSSISTAQGVFILSMVLVCPDHIYVYEALRSSVLCMTSLIADDFLQAYEVIFFRHLSTTPGKPAVPVRTPTHLLPAKSEQDGSGVCVVEAHECPSYVGAVRAA